MIVVALVLGGLLLFAFVRSQGRVTGTEFAPTNFQTRSFRFYEVPVLQIQLTPIERTGMISPMTTFLRKKSYIPRPKAAPTQDGWHLVRITRGVSGTTPGDAQLLTEHLGMSGADDLKWKIWSENHPAKAKTLWPIVKKLAERELYILVPGLFQKAEMLSAAQQPAKNQPTQDLPVEKDFAASIDDWLLKQYIGVIGDMRAAKRNTLADGLLKEALADFPDSPELTELGSEMPKSN